MSDPLFNVGDWITTKIPIGLIIENRTAGRLPHLVIERLIQDCPGGRQVHYKCRATFPQRNGRKEFVLLSSTPDRYITAGLEIIQFNEVEVESWNDSMLPPEVDNEKKENA